MAQKVGSETPDSGDSALGKTQTTTIQISGDDGSVFPATVYTSVNVTDDPELLQPLEEGTLNEVESPTEEGRIYRPAVPVVYHDEERQVFALIIPEALRHEEFGCRRQLLDVLASHNDVVPGYMRRFDVVFDPSRLEHLGQGPTAGPAEKTQLIENPALDADVKHLREQLQDKERELEELRLQLQEDTEDSASTKSAVDAAELDERLRELEERERQLEIDREQLDEVASRVERDSARVEEASRRNEERRAELDHQAKELQERERKLQVRELNLEQKELEIQKESELAMASGVKPYANEGTQVVTDDQFIEVVDAGEPQAAAASAPVADAQAVEAARPRRPEPTSRRITTVDTEHVPGSYPDGEESGGFVTQTSDLVLVGYALDDERAKRFAGQNVEFLFQVQHVDDIPVIALTLAAFDEDGECVDAVTAPMTDQSERQRTILDKLARDLHIYLAIYGADGQLVQAWEAGGPLRRNIGWARQRLRKWRESVNEPEMADKKATELNDDDRELVGSMRHPFEAQSFAEFDGASDVKLAASIVGYWSEAEQFDYLIGNRAFPLQIFLNIQKRVVRQALHWGLAFGDALQQVAVDEAIILDKKSMVQRLLSNFAEVCVGLRTNDLDPLEQWENWDMLIEMAEEQGVTPDPDVLELAEKCLKRAEEYEEIVDGDEEIPAPEVVDHSEPAVGDVEVEKRFYDDGGVTYFTPTESSGELFDELWGEERQELESLLEDGDLRVISAQILIEKYGADAVTEVLEPVEQMGASEVEALSRFCEERADELEAALMQALDAAGPQATVLAGRALSALGSAAALPPLLEAVKNGVSDNGATSLANCLAKFGDKLIPPLSRELKKDPEDEGLLAVLAALETQRAGTLDELADQRSDNLREAARRARQLI